MQRIKNILSVFLIIYVTNLYAQQGKNGAETVSTINAVVNEYTALTADAQAGATAISVSNSGLNTNGRFSQSLSAGDLILIIQMQGASINGSPTDSTWGAVTNYNNCGLYEFSEVETVPNGTTISINCALKNNYTASGNTQIVRVPRFTSLTVNTGDTLTCDSWNGATGGIVVTEVANNVMINSGGVINATGKGFRGGILENSEAIYDVQTYATTTNEDSGGQKGESIAGSGAAYDVYGGMFGRGAPANGGGGGNSFNSSGGGGANAGMLSEWNGDGNPDTSVSSWITAWNLEYNGFANSASSGGGRGGYCFSWTTQNPLTDPPGNPNWTGDYRYNHGGKGGRPLDYSTGRIFFGGGGGAGQEDNFNGSGGANGGGIVYLLCYGKISGNGYILSNGDNGPNSTGDYGANGDGSGGAGGGGTIILYSADTISGITAIANGGIGGNQVIPGGDEAEGPGGGGGGGYIATSNSNITQQALGGANGVTNSPAVAGFPPNGATMGGSGMVNQIITGIPFSTLTANAGPGVTICSGGNATLHATGGAAYLWSPSQSLSCDTCANPVASPTATTIYYVTVSSGSCAGIDSVVVTVSNSEAGVITAANNPVCGGTSDSLSLTGSSGNIYWQSSATGFNYSNVPGADGSVLFIQAAQTAYYRVVTDSGTCADTSQPFELVVNPLPATPILTATDTAVCSPDSVLISASGPDAFYIWNDGDTTPYTYAKATGEYWVTVTNSYGCTAISGQQQATIFPPPVPPVLGTNDSIICASDSALITTSGSYSSYLWNNGDNRSFTYANDAGGYWVTVTDANGCTAVSGHLEISVYPVPSVSIIEEGDTLSSYGANSYQWYFNNNPISNATGPVYIAGQSGEYSVEVTDTNGCQALSNNTLIIITGTAAVSVNNQTRFFPNPSTGMLYIAVGDDIIQGEIRLVNMAGEEVKRKDLPVGSNRRVGLDITDLPGGMYELQALGENKLFTAKLMKE